jgi:hypothetical protein
MVGGDFNIIRYSNEKNKKGGLTDSLGYLTA